MKNSQRLLVFSDTHGDSEALAAVLEWAKNQPVDAAVFLGDGVSDVVRSPWRPGGLKIIRGNSDFDESIRPPDAALLDFAGRRFFLCHGHRYSLGGGFDTLVAAARSHNADAALFGHTHVPFCQTLGGLLLLNPGSVGRPRSSIGATFAVIECQSETTLKSVFWQVAKNPSQKIEIKEIAIRSD